MDISVLRNKNILLISAHHSVAATYVRDESIVELGWSQIVAETNRA